jgi:DNA modification methylase
MAPTTTAISRGNLIHGDALEVLPSLPANHFQLIIADSPYHQVLTDEDWDNKWESPDDYTEWMASWVRECRRLLRPDGLLFVFGQLGQREHVWLHVASRLARDMQFHDMIIWDRAVGYNERQDSFTPQYEMILVLRTSREAKPYFDKSAVRIPYDPATIKTYLRDNRYKDREARLRHLELGKRATNILRVPSLKGSSKEKTGHPSQKPLTLINHLVRAASRPGDWILDPFLGSGTTAVSAENLARRWFGIEENPAYVAMAMNRIQKAIEERKQPAPGSEEQ